MLNQKYVYDPIGNRIEWTQYDAAGAADFVTAYTPNELNQYSKIEAGGVTVPTPAYDEDGNLKVNGDWTYTWNAENQLSELEKTDQKLKFVYDGLGRRVAKEVYSPDGAGGWSLDSDIQFIYDDWNLVAEIQSVSSSLSALKTYTWGMDLSGSLQGAGGVGGLLAVASSDLSEGDAAYAPAYDFNGNIIAYIDPESTGETELVVAEFEYGPFGELIRATGSKADEFSFRFSTKYEDAETGLLYYGFRYYDRVTGRWLSRDPIEEQGGLNLYSNVGNSLINKYDILGLSTVAKRRQFSRAPAFIKHYFLGNGETYEVKSNDRLYRKLWNSIDGKVNYIKDEAKLLMPDPTKEQCESCSMKYEEKYRTKFTVYPGATRTLSGLSNPIHIFNEGVLVVDYSCGGSIKCGSDGMLKSGFIKCNIELTIEDRFANPLDWGHHIHYEYTDALKLKYKECVSKCSNLGNRNGGKCVLVVEKISLF